MSKRLFKTMVALLAIAAAAAGPVRAQSHQKYTSGTVAVSALQEGDTLCAGVTINKDVTGTGVFAANRWKYGNPPVVKDGGAYFNVESCTILDGAAIAWSDGYATPVDENGNDGDAWIVTSKTGTDFVQLYLGGILLPAPPKYTVRMAEGTEDAANWSIASGNVSVDGTQVLENVMSGSEVTATYSGTRKVKSVKAVKYVPPAATVTTAPTATTALIEAGSTTALVNAGAANGGTMMYAVTTTNAQPASTADFSATRPTAQGRTAGTYYVWFYAKADAEHSDSEIAGPVSVTVTSAPTTVTWNSSNIGGSYPNGLNVSGTSTSYTKEGITLSANADMNGAQWQDYGDENYGIRFQVNESGGFTFSNTLGKSFTKIEMTLTGQGGWDMASLGTGWAFGENFDPMTMDDPIYKVTWTGSAASTVGLLTGANDFGGTQVKSIVFTLIDAQ